MTENSETAPTCAVGPCQESRVDGTSRCAKHVPVTHKRNAPKEKKGPQSAAIVCPHCQTKGNVKTKQVKVKRGVSGGKATAAVFTVGTSMLATGLSRKERVTEATCSNCGVLWHM